MSSVGFYPVEFGASDIPMICHVKLSISAVNVTHINYAIPWKMQLDGTIYSYMKLRKETSTSSEVSEPSLGHVYSLLAILTAPDPPRDTGFPNLQVVNRFSSYLQFFFLLLLRGRRRTTCGW